MLTKVQKLLLASQLFDSHFTWAIREKVHKGTKCALGARYMTIWNKYIYIYKTDCLVFGIFYGEDKLVI